MRVEELTRNKPVFFQHVVENKTYPYVGKIPYLAKTRNRQQKKEKCVLTKKTWQYGFPGALVWTTK